ncbi:uncharacterized protein LOC125790791 [Astyanax mexicanus]|uniref:uncharacterized protein LOC125790791 n=1 Tax=Astyanax mexicanus TaxID=7994 RepID=UPI0020CB2C7F|nr:uncharacterized protein LOC125790791 [Astyanax mexicanus]
MTKRAVEALDWTETQIPQITYSNSTKSYCIQIQAIDRVLWEHRFISRHHGRELCDHQHTEILLASIPDTLWATGPTDVGLVNDCADITFELQTDRAIWVRQYSHKPIAEEGIADTIQGLCQAGVLEPSNSPWNTPILPVEKKGTGKYRMAHDLRAINAVLVTHTIAVPNPYVALSQLTPTQTWFTCIDLANAFFCLPLHPDCRDCVSFTFRGQQYRYTRLPQGFALSPGLFNQVLKRSLEGVDLPENTTLVQYVDDVLLASETDKDCLTATHNVLQRLSDKGYKVSKDKLQVGRRQVSFLGRILSGSGTNLSPIHKSSILSHSKPQKVKDMLSFLGLTGYSRHYVPNYSGLTQPLRAMVNACGMRNVTAQLDWTTEAEQAFIELKQLLAQATDLATPDYSKPFFMDVSETEGVVNGVLFQKRGGERNVLMHASIMLDRMEKRHPECTQHVAGVAKLVQKTAHIVMGHPLTILTTHSVVAYVNSHTFTLTTLRQQRLSKILEAPNLTYTHEGINMAERMGEFEPHECEKLVERTSKVRADLQAEPIPGGENLYTDGCCFRHEQEGLVAGFAVVEEEGGEFHTVKAERLKGQQSAQRAELRGVIEALKYGADQVINIFSDSSYVVLAVHVDLGQWQRGGFRTAGNTPIKYEKEMRELAEALFLPKQVAIIKCKGHDEGHSVVARGNRAADEAAKRVTGYKVSYVMMTSEQDGQLMQEWNGDETGRKITPREKRAVDRARRRWEANKMEREQAGQTGHLEGDKEAPGEKVLDTDYSISKQWKLKKNQEKAESEEKTAWIQREAKDHGGVWRGPDGRFVLPSTLKDEVLSEAHGVGHVGISQMLRNVQNWWHPQMKNMVTEFVSRCEVCMLYNPKKTIKPPLGKFSRQTTPAGEIVIDYTDMIEPVRGYRYILMCVDIILGGQRRVLQRKRTASL